MPAYCLRPNLIEVPLANGVAIPGGTVTPQGTNFFLPSDALVYINGVQTTPFMVQQYPGSATLSILLGSNIYSADKVRVNFCNSLAAALTDWVDVNIIYDGISKSSQNSSVRFGAYLKTSTWDPKYTFTPQGVASAPPQPLPYVRVFPDGSDSCIEKLINLTPQGEIGETFSAQVDVLSAVGIIGEVLLLSGTQDNFVQVSGSTAWQTASAQLTLAARGDITLRLGIGSGDGEVDFKNVKITSNLRGVVYTDPLVSTLTWISSGSALPSVDENGNMYASWRESFDPGQLSSCIVNMAQGQLTIIPESL